jgi:hypothetical protein
MRKQAEYGAAELSKWALGGIELCCFQLDDVSSSTPKAGQSSEMRHFTSFWAVF